MLAGRGHASEEIGRGLVEERKRLLVLVHWLAMLVCAFYIPFDWLVRADHHRVFVQLAVFIVFSLSLYLLVRRGWLEFSTRLLLGLVSAEILFSFYQALNTPQAIIELFWICALVPAAYHLAGRRIGLGLSQLLFLSVWLLYLYAGRTTNSILDLPLLIEYSLSFQSISAISFLYIRAHERHMGQVLSYSRSLAFANNELKTVSLTDALTGVFNRKFLDELLTELCGRQAGQFPFSMLMIDIDHFKKVNDTHGHQVGDEVLIRFTQGLKAHLRDKDILGRWGGEEFMIISPALSPGGAEHLAERLRKEMEAAVYTQGQTITCSIGASSYRSNESKDQLIKRVDSALYQAKETGRNRVVAAT